MSERAPVPDSEWQKFSSQNEAAVEAERTNIRRSERPWPKPGTPEANEVLVNSIESGELTYEELDQMALQAYKETPPSERNWRRDAGFYQLTENERHQELIAEAIRDTRALSETLRAAIRDPQKQRRLRELLQEIDNELQQEPGR